MYKLDKKLRKGFLLHQQGEINKAKLIYKEILSCDPNCVPALFYLAVVKHQSKKYEMAIDLLKRVIELKSDFVDAHLNLGNIYFSLGRFDEAEKIYLQAAGIMPRNYAIYNNLGMIYLSVGRYEESALNFKKTIALNPAFAEAFNNLGNAQINLKQYAEAFSNFTTAITLNEKFVDSYCGAASCQIFLGDFRRALDLLNKAIDYDGCSAYAYFEKGRAESSLGLFEASCASFGKAIEILPNFAEAYNHRGNALKYLNRLEEAIVHYRTAIKIKPEYAESYSNMGVALYEKAEYRKALECYNKAVAIDQEYAEAYINKGVVLRELGFFEDAISNYDAALALDETLDVALYNKGLLLLLLGKFEEGWVNFEVRKKIKYKSAPHKSLNKEILKIEKNLYGKKIFLSPEEGFGDMIQFVRYVFLLEKSGAKIFMDPYQNMKRLFASIPASFDFIDPRDREIDFDFHCSIMSLPSIYGTREDNIPRQVPYLFAEPQIIEKWSRYLGPAGFRIGICWQGSKRKIDIGRSFPIALFDGISKLKGIRLISLHKGAGESQLASLPDNMTVEVLGADFDGGEDAFIDTAAIMMCCDLIITSDTAIAHLAGALGVPVWVALQHIPDWRWLLERRDSPWYPTMRLFRQKTPGDWESVFTEIEMELKALLEERNI